MKSHNAKKLVLFLSVRPNFGDLALEVASLPTFLPPTGGSPCRRETALPTLESGASAL